MEVKLIHTTLTDYSKEVETLLVEGWQLSGDVKVCVDSYGDPRWVVQRLVREVK